MMLLTLMLALLPHQDAKTIAAKAIETTRAQQSYTTRFEAVITMPEGDPYEIKGESVWTRPGILYIRYTGSGKDEKRIIRVGNHVWIYHEFLEDWVTAEEMGNAGAGRGVQNPEDVLAVISGHLDNASMGEKTDSGLFVNIPLDGKDIESIMKEQANQGSFDWEKSRAAIVLKVKNGRVETLESSASLLSKDPNIQDQAVAYNATVTVVAFNEAKELSFEIVDEKTKKTRPIPIPKYINKAIREFKTRK